MLEGHSYSLEDNVVRGLAALLTCSCENTPDDRIGFVAHFLLPGPQQDIMAAAGGLSEYLADHFYTLEEHVEYETQSIESIYRTLAERGLNNPFKSSMPDDRDDPPNTPGAN